MDNIAIHTGRKEGETEDEHIARHCLLVRKVLDRLRKNDLHLNLEKCTFEQDHLDFLGVRVTILPPFFHFSHSRDFTCP